MSNIDIYNTLIELGVREIDIARYLSLKTGRSVHSWAVKINDGVVLHLYKQNAQTVKEFAKYGMEMLSKKIEEVEQVLETYYGQKKKNSCRAKKAKV